MPEIVLSQLAQQSGIDEGKLLKRIQQVDPAYQGEAISGTQAFDLVPGVRRQNALLTLGEAMALTQALQSIAERPDESPLAAEQVSTQSTSTQGTNDMNDDESLEQQARRNWKADADLRAEFGGEFEMYLAYSEAVAAGKVRVANSTVKRGADYV